jgi:flagellin FlaB
VNGVRKSSKWKYIISTKAAIGIGALIVFISLVLVAGIGATVIIQTMGSLEDEALRTGEETTEEVSTGIGVFNIEGKIKPNDDLRDIAITVRPRAGSADIDLNETIILISDGSIKSLLTYYGWSDQNLFNLSVNQSGQIFANKSATPWTNGTLAWGNLTNDYFGIVVLKDPDGSCTRLNPIINSGDKIALCLRCDTTKLFGDAIDERTDIYGRIIPETGSPGIISFTTPSIYNNQIFILQ